ncbi:MAG: DUF4383 domain-containing protein [Acidobacteria bacterium]|nr:DUF4383 domain-containing protein [Acidobacteriota bacterium]
MTIRTFSLVVGIVFLLAGLLGFIDALKSLPPTDAPTLSVSAGYGYLFGLFPVNMLHNFVHLGIGVWGLTSSRNYPAARTFAYGLMIFYGALAVMGLIPVLNTTFGLIPIFGHDVWLHALTALAAAYFWRAPAEVDVHHRDVTGAGHL